MEIKGKCIQVMPTETGMGKKGQWNKTTFIIETPGQYPKRVALTTWKTENIPAVGDELTCHLDIESREYNGRWYTEVRAWKIEGFTGNMKAAQSKKTDFGQLEKETIPDSAFGSDEGDLPF